MRNNKKVDPRESRVAVWPDYRSDHDASRTYTDKYL